MYSTILSGALLGVNACPVQVEVDVAAGLPTFSMVGSLGGEVREARERVWAALKNAGLEIPPMRITVNLSPGDIRKEGTAFDLPIAMGLLEALSYFPTGRLQNTLLLGELGLNGEIRKVKGVLPIVRKAAQLGIGECIVPRENVREAAVISDIRVRGASDISEILTYLQAKEEERERVLPVAGIKEEELPETGGLSEENDFAQVKGQEMAKRAAEIAAAGFHNLLMTGPPGAGKSMIAKCIPGIMPPLTKEERLEVTSVYSVAGLLGDGGLIKKRPFQSPHHTISPAALMGGGTVPRPGVISLSHRGVLFLDELPEFPGNVLNSMRQPLEERRIQLVRVGGNLVYPADFMLVGAMNPCPCGYYPDRNRCRCSIPQIKHYMGKISGPILDRIDLCVELQRVGIEKIQQRKGGESSEVIRLRVLEARQRQKVRFRDSEYRFNGDIKAKDMERYCRLGKEELGCMEELYRTMELSARAYHRIVKVARTIADLAGAAQIGAEHLLEAACYRTSQDYWL
ncbi:MAG: YifB family Mg chelatase-like AAA ATPase [Roseburia sp.]|nr:YifB family Mg chelatase-like AAA ATPase [Roseburia sp.]